MWPDCSPPSDSPRASISSITYLSPTAQRTRSMPRVAQRELETDVAHHGRDDRVALQPPFALQLARAHQQHRVAVDDPAAMIDEDRAIAVAVERDAHLAAALDDRPRERARDASTRSRRLMLRPSGSVADDDRLEARGSRTTRGATVVVAPLAQSTASVKPLERLALPGTPRAGDRGRRRRDRRCGDRRRLAAARRPGRVGDDRLDLALDALGELLAAAGEHLDAVVFERIVRGGDHDAGVVARRSRVR